MRRGLLYIVLLIGTLSGYQFYPNNQNCVKPSDNIVKRQLYFHPVHISFTNIEFNPATKKFEILFKLFVDDFTLILNKKYGKKIDLLVTNPAKENQETIDKYILEHFKLIINGKDKTKSDLTFSRMDVKEQSIWLYYNLNFKGNCNTFDVHNSLMNDLYPDQTNLLIFTFKDEQKALKFSSTKTSEKLTF